MASSDSFTTQGNIDFEVDGLDGIYEGDLVNGKPHGKGRMTFDDGTVKDGNWENGEFIG